MTRLSVVSPKRTFLPSVARLEERSLLSTFGGGNIDTSIPRFPSTLGNYNLTSNTFNQVNGRISDVAETIVANTNTTTSQLTSLVQRLPRGQNRLLPILLADVQAFNQNSGVISIADAEASINTLFLDLLGRPADPAALDLGGKAIQDGATIQDVTNLIVSSPEYIGQNITAGATGNQNQTQYVTALYNDVLGRAPDTAGLNFWVNQINTNSSTLAQVASSFVNSPEATNSPTSIINTDAFPSPPQATYFYGQTTPDGRVTGNFGSGATISKTDQLSNLIQNDILAYLEQGIGTRFNILKSKVNFSTDRLLTYNGRV